MAEVLNDWRARLISVLDDKLDEQTKVALKIFAQTARTTVKRLLVENVSDVMLKAVARPTLQIAYTQFLYACGVPYVEPSREFIDSLLGDLIREIQSRKASA